MIDLFGLGKDKETPGEEPESQTPVPEASIESISEAAPEAPRGSHRLWAILLVLDSVFVIVFGGAVAAKVYQYWRAPAAPATAAARRKPAKEAPKPEPAAEAAAPAPAPTPAPEPPKETVKAEPPKPAPEKAPAPAPGRPPKPSLLSDAPKHRETPRLAGTDKEATTPPKAPVASAPAPDAGKPNKALPVEFKIRAPNAKSVSVVGAFIVRGGRRDLNRHGDGTWSITLYLNPGQYRYFFSVDKKKVLDPENPRTEKGSSVLSVP